MMITDLGRHDFTLNENRTRQKEKGPGTQEPGPSSVAYSNLPLGDHRRRGLALADLRAAGDARGASTAAIATESFFMGSSP